jgi:hypothetical protein
MRSANILRSFVRFPLSQTIFPPSTPFSLKICLTSFTLILSCRRCDPSVAQASRRGLSGRYFCTRWLVDELDGEEIAKDVDELVFPAHFDLPVVFGIPETLRYRLIAFVGFFENGGVDNELGTFEVELFHPFRYRLGYRFRPFLGTTPRIVMVSYH